MPSSPTMPLQAQQVYEDTKFILGMENGPREQWQTWQRRRLTDMLKWLVQMPHWTEYLKPLMKDGAVDMHAYDRWIEMPVMNRSTYRQLIESHTPQVPESHGGLHEHSTSGSSGIPVTFWCSAVVSRLNESHYWADGRRQGRPLDSNALVLSAKRIEGEGNDLERSPDPWLHSGRFIARHAPTFTIGQNAAWLSQRSREVSSNGKLTALSTYPTLLSAILFELEQSTATPIRIDQISTFAETVDPALREHARRVVGASIRDRYSCEELGPIAFQCPRSDDYLHVAVMNVIAEVVDDEGHRLGNGQEGNVLVTGLHQWASPAMRYELSDVGSLLDSCPACGVQVPVFTNLLGRKRCLVRRANGELHYVRVSAVHWLPCAPIREFRMVQVERFRFEVELVAARALTLAELEAIDRMLHNNIGSEFAFDISERESIAWPPGRKRQEITSLIP